MLSALAMEQKVRLVLTCLPMAWFAIASNCATAQQYYTFEEACALAGQTTGACAPSAEQEISIGCVPLGGNAFHAIKPAGPCIETSLAPSLDAELFVQLIGLENIPKINELSLTIGRSAGFQNAVAIFREGSRMIIHDPKWARDHTTEFYLILGHEAGHHFCGHTLGGALRNPHEVELEADRFSGASIKRYEIYHGKIFLKSALEIAEKLFSASGSRSHPPRAERIEAIKLGYEQGSACGDLAPPIPGYSPSP